MNRPRAWHSRLEGPALAVAVVAMAAGLYLALRERPLSPATLEWSWLAAVLLAGVPLITLANACRLALSFRLTGQRRTAVELLRASVLSSAANMLPLPGGVLVRIAYLRSADVSVGRATGITVGVAAVWFALASVGTGLALTLLRSSALGPLLLLGGVAGAAGGWFYLSRLPEGKSAFAWLLLLECAVFVVQAFRFLWCFQAMGYPAQWLQGLALSVACVSGAVVSIVPAGLGVLELAAVLIAPFARLDPAATFLAVFLDRIATMLGLFVAAAALTARRAPSQPSAPA